MGDALSGCCCAIRHWREFYYSPGVFLNGGPSDDPDDTHPDYTSALSEASHIITRVPSSILTGVTPEGWEDGKFAVDATDLFIDELEKFDDETYTPFSVGDMYLSVVALRHPYSGDPVACIVTNSLPITPLSGDGFAWHICTFNADDTGSTELAVGEDILPLSLTIPAVSGTPSGSTYPTSYDMTDLFTSANKISELSGERAGALGIYKEFFLSSSGGTPANGDILTFAYTAIISPDGVTLSTAKGRFGEGFVSGFGTTDYRALNGMAAPFEYSHDNAPRAVGSKVVIDSSGSPTTYTYSLVYGDALSDVIDSPTELASVVSTDSPPGSSFPNNQTFATGFDAHIRSGGVELIWGRVKDGEDYEAWIDGTTWTGITHNDMLGAWNLSSPLYEVAPTAANIAVPTKPRSTESSVQPYELHELFSASSGLAVQARESTAQHNWYTGEINGIEVLTDSNDIAVIYTEAAEIRTIQYRPASTATGTTRTFTTTGGDLYGEPDGYKTTIVVRTRIELFEDGVLTKIVRREDSGDGPDPGSSTTTLHASPEGNTLPVVSGSGGFGDTLPTFTEGLETTYQGIVQRNDRYWYLAAVNLETGGDGSITWYAIKADGEYHAADRQTHNGDPVVTNDFASEIAPFSTIEEPIPFNAKAIKEG